MSTVGVFASIFDTAGRLLLVRHAYGSRQWTTPGGRVEQGESPLAALQREVMEEIVCEVRIAHLIGVYAKPYRDDLVLSFFAELVRGTPRACLPEISEITFFAREELPREVAFNSRVRVEDAFENCRGVVRVFDSAASLVPSFSHVARVPAAPFCETPSRGLVSDTEPYNFLQSTIHFSPKDIDDVLDFVHSQQISATKERSSAKSDRNEQLT